MAAVCVRFHGYPPQITITIGHNSQGVFVGRKVKTRANSSGVFNIFKDKKIGCRYVLRSFHSSRPLASRRKRLSPTTLLGFATAGQNREGCGHVEGGWNRDGWGWDLGSVWLGVKTGPSRLHLEERKWAI